MLRSARRTRKSEARRTNQARRPNSRPAAWGLWLRASATDDQKPRVKTSCEEGQGGKDKRRSPVAPAILSLALGACFVLCTSSFVLGTMTPAASEPALSEVEGTEARKRNIFAETTILYACT